MTGLSNWREEFNLSEVVTGKMTDTKALQKVSEKSNINNKVTINPKLDEAVKEIGGEVIGMVEQDTTAQKQRLDMKQMILDRQKLKIRRKDMSAAKQEKKNGVDGDPTVASKQSNVITQEAVQGQDTATRKAMAGERKAGDKRVAPGKAKQNAERVMQSVRFYDKITKGKHIAGVAEEAEETVKQVNEKKRKNALQIQKVIGEGDWIQKATKNMRKDKPCTGEKFGSESCPPGSKRYNLAKTFRKMAKEETEVNEGVMKFVKSIGKKKKVEKKPSMDTITTKVHKWRKDREKEERRKYVSDFDPIDESKIDDVKKSIKKGVRIAKRVAKDATSPYDPGSSSIGSLGNPHLGNEEKRAKERAAKKKVSEGTDKAFEFVKKKIEKEVGKSGYVSKDNPRKPPTAAQKKAAAAHQAKVDKENAAARAKDPSQGRYPKG